MLLWQIRLIRRRAFSRGQRLSRMKIHKEKSVAVYKCDYFTVYRDAIVFPNKKKGVYNFVKSGDTIGVLAIRNGKVLMVKQYKYPIKKFTLEIPRGFIEKGESPKAAALRELEEETGYKAGRIVPMGKMYTIPGITTELSHIFF